MRNLAVYGLGELGQLYGAAALRAGYRVTPITRADDPQVALHGLPLDVPVLVAVGEASLDEVLTALGKSRGDAVILLQNELFPSLWRKHDIQPTVLVPWLLKKRGTPLLVARPSPVLGRHAEVVLALHQALALPCDLLPHEHALHQALVEKYAFILTINALGLLRDRTLGLWLQEDPGRVAALARETAQLGAVLCESEVDLPRCERVVVEAMRALSTVSARGRSAEARVARAVSEGQRIGLELPELARAAPRSDDL
jgi:hypothetical protein